jgi:hypothetical protein
LAIWLTIVAGGLGWTGYEIVTLGQTHLLIRKPNILNKDLDALKAIPNAGYPFKINVRCGGRPKIRHAWFAMHGFVPYCTHWKGTGPEATYNLCYSLGDPKRNGALYAMAGIRWFTGWGPKIKSLKESVDEDGLPVLKRLPVGKDRYGQNNSSRVTMDSGFKTFLRPFNAQPLPVVATDRQWVWLAKNWTNRFKNKLWDPKLPLILRVKPGQLEQSQLLKTAKAVLYFDHSKLEKDFKSLKTFADHNGVIISPVEIDDIKTALLATDEQPWVKLPAAINGGTANIHVHQREELDPGLEIARIEQIIPRRRTFQKFVFDIENIKPILAVLPLENFPGWTARLNGKTIPLFSAGPDLIGVQLPKGVHRLKIIWEMPLSHRITIWISILATLLVLVYWIRRTIKLARDERYIPSF